jgi:hypothetical protein
MHRVSVVLGTISVLILLAGHPIEPAAASLPRVVTQPPPPVSASAFPEEAIGTVPSDGDGLIPNPASPSGTPVGPPDSCSVTFTAGGSVTSATVNAWIASNENSIATPTTVCLSGTFGQPLHVWSKSSTALLEIAPEPGETATLDLGPVQAADTDPNQYWSDTGGISIVDSRSVEVYGLTVENYTFDGPAHVPAGIYVTVRSDTTNTNQSVVPHLSACYLNGGSCSDIYILDDTVEDVTNTADESPTDQSVCGNPNVDAYGIAVISAGSSSTEALQHVVVEDNTVTGTRTGQSETVTLNGDLEDFLAAGNLIGPADNIGIDTIGWETGKSQARHGLLEGNTVYDVDTYDNTSYGRWSSGRCLPRQENAAGVYDDGASYVWIDGNTVWNTDQGINLDVETASRSTDHLLVSGNTVHDDPGTSSADPSEGTEPPGVPGTSTVAGHDVVALYVDAFGSKSSITDVYVHDNTFENQSQFFLKPSSGMPVVDLGGDWSNVQFWHNAVDGLDASDRYNTLFEVDRQPSGGNNVVDCNDYGNLSSSGSTVNGNFALPSKDWLSFQKWQRHNGHGWDADSAVDAFATACPSNSLG